MPHGTDYITLPLHIVFLLSKQIAKYHATLQLFTPLRVFIHPLTTTVIDSCKFVKINEQEEFVWQQQKHHHICIYFNNMYNLLCIFSIQGVFLHQYDAY